MNYPSIRMEGGILSPDILDRIEDADGQKPSHFELDPSAKVKDEILRVWADAQDLWRIFQHKLESLKGDSPATTETRNLWIVPFLSLLGYQLEYQARGAELNGKIYPISHRVTNRKQTPVHIIGYREPSGLDRKPEKMTLRMSAHALIQEYLNLSDELYGLVTNGRLLRVLRDSSRLVKLSYLEFDLDRIFTDGLFADFAILFRLLHATRLPKNEENAASCWLERYHQKSLDEGTRIRDGLRDAVTEALEVLGTGFLAHPENTALRQQLSCGELQPEIYFNHLLRLVYRLLFLMVVEERGLVFPKGVPAKNVSLYFQHYSIQRLRRLAVTRGLKVERFHDAWLSLLATFQLFENPAQATKLGTTVFAGKLFNPESLGSLIYCRLTNATMLTALERLCYFDHPETKQRTPVNFGALATEEFGSVYESLLELHPVVEIEPAPHFGFRQVAGNERKSTGSYYTPTSLVTCLLDSALDPVLEDRIKNFKALGFKSVDEAVLALNVCDPACGSGHFLIAAAQRIARRLAILRAGDEEPSPELLRRTLREVIGNCIHGVDVNPMSVELCKVALWLEAVEPGKPLNFLDHHLRCGNSLLGAAPECIRNGIPDAAYEPITGDNMDAAKWMEQLNKEAREGQGHLDFSDAMPWERLGNLPAAVAKLEDLSDDSPEAVALKEKVYQEIVQDSAYENARLLYDTWCSAFVWPKETCEYGAELTTEHLRKIEGNPYNVTPKIKDTVRSIAGRYRFFHWHLEFPAVFGSSGKGGFDVILGNPPWERTAFEEIPYFSSLAPEIAAAETTALRQQLIAELETSDPKMWQQYRNDRRESDGRENLCKNSGRYPFASSGRTNTFALFTELSLSITGQIGSVGLIIPSALATDIPYAEFWSDILERRCLVSMFDFENRGVFFPNVHSSYKFSLFTFKPNRDAAIESKFGFFLSNVEDIRNRGKVFTLSQRLVTQLNPITKLLPVCRTIHDFGLLLALHRLNKPLMTEATPWVGLTSSATSKNWFFNEREECPNPGYVAFWEAKCIHQFDHRFSTYAGTDRSEKLDGRPKLFEFDSDPESSIVTRYHVPESMWLGHLKTKQTYVSGTCGYRDVARSTDERTMISAVVPFAGFMQPLNGISHKDPKALLRLVACLNSFALDFSCRQKTPGTHVNVTICKQLPTLLESAYSGIDAMIGEQGAGWILKRALELTYTAFDLESFAHDCSFNGPPFRWDEERRFNLRCELDAAFFHLYLGSDEQWRRQPGEPD